MVGSEGRRDGKRRGRLVSNGGGAEVVKIPSSVVDVSVASDVNGVSEGNVTSDFDIASSSREAAKVLNVSFSDEFSSMSGWVNLVNYEQNSKSKDRNS